MGSKPLPLGGSLQLPITRTPNRKLELGFRVPNQLERHKVVFAGPTMTARDRLPNRRASETFELTVADISYTCTLSRYSDGRIAELFLSNHKSASAADVGARDAAIAFSFAVQHGADSEAIRLALSRDSHGHPSGPLGAALDLLAEGDRGP
jgi:hypothetical protein